jgi:hypothetical protein
VDSDLETLGIVFQKQRRHWNDRIIERLCGRRYHAGVDYHGRTKVLDLETACDWACLAGAKRAERRRNVTPHLKNHAPPRSLSELHEHMRMPYNMLCAGNLQVFHASVVAIYPLRAPLRTVAKE